MVKSLVSKLSSASNLSLASTFSSISGSNGNNTSIQETNYLKHRNDPGRFFGDGVQFKAKLIGILEVGEARGDRMCQEALQDLKMAIRAAGEHKQRIIIHVTIDGLRLRDEKTGDSLYHHPVHKISFIAQDMTDSRAFGYIFGSPDSGHRFFGIKTDKAASQVVLAMRDLFQVVFELKKKEIELARQQIQTKSIHEHHLTSLSSIKSAGHSDINNSGNGGSVSGPNSLTMMSSLGGQATSSGISRLGVNLDSKGAAKEMSPESVADLVDLEQELSSLQRGITQMERITPNEPVQPTGIGITSKNSTDDDPFGDSFTNFPTYNLLPPPESDRSRNKPNKPADINTNTGSQNIPIASILSPATLCSSSPAKIDDDDGWLNEIEQNDVFDTSKTNVMGIGVNLPIAPLAPSESTSTPTQQLSDNCGLADIELATNSNMLAGQTGNLSSTAIINDVLSSVTTDLSQSSTQAPVISDSVTGIMHASDAVMLPRETDPFSPTRKKSDPFQEGDIFSQLDPFEFDFVNKTETTVSAQRASPSSSTTTDVQQETRRSADVFKGALQVNLPPESSRISPPTAVYNSTIRSRPQPSGQLSSSSSHTSSSVLKQQTVDVISSISNKKMPHLFGQSRFPKRESNSINMRRLQESDSLSENEAAPEPPPRPDSLSHIEPPPLPPKKQFNDIIIRPRVTSGNAVPPQNTLSNTRYDFINSSSKLSSSSSRNVNSTINNDVPPIPLPSRRIGRSDGSYPGPGRPRKPGHTEDDYLAPISATADVPPLLPPPMHGSTRGRIQRQQTLTKPQDIYENKSEILQQQQQQQQQQQTDENVNSATISDITLTQLLTLGIDELATKLNVPTSKLNTMTLVELTSYLSEFIEKSKPGNTQKTESPSPLPSSTHKSDVVVDQTPVFRVNFDQQATFVAKFDDTFGEDISASFEKSPENFVANFAQFSDISNTAPNLANTATSVNQVPAIPPADRYAVFREIIDQELNQQTDLLGELSPTDEETVNVNQSNIVEAVNINFDANFDDDMFVSAPPTIKPPQLPKIDTNITEVVAQAKDRYAALRDIILVENLFEQKPNISESEKDLMQEYSEFGDEDQDIKKILDDRASSTGADRSGLVDSRGFPAEPSSSAITVEDDDEDDENGGAESSLDSNEKDADAVQDILSQDKYEKLSTSTQQLDVDKSDKGEICGVADDSQQQFGNHVNIKQDNKFLTVSGVGNRDDFEIDELMQRAISNLSLDSRERTSPANSTNAIISATTTIARPKDVRTGVLSTQVQFNDMSTSPIPLQKSPVPFTAQAKQQQQQQKSPISKSGQISPMLSQLSAVSNLIETASKQIDSTELIVEANLVETAGSVKATKESWATFDSPKTEVLNKRLRTPKTIKTATLHLPPAPPSNTSQNDTAESPCSSDPRDEGWSKSARRWSKKERQQTSSSSRDLSPWDDEAPDFQKQKRLGMPTAPIGVAQHSHTDRHGYYMRHARRMNSCDEDYDYEEEIANRREHRKFKHGLSRSRDNFDLESPSWYHHTALHHTWSPQDIEQSSIARSGRSFERSAYERTTYGPPIYDKRGIAQTGVNVSSYDRRSGYDKRKFYRDFVRPNYDFEGYGESGSIQDRYRDTGSFEKLKSSGRRSDYENVYDDGRSPMGYKARIDYLYERDRKSFDRDSVESFESASRRRRSFGSGDVYGSLESREDFRERYMGGGGEKTRSLRKGMKIRAMGDIDYEQDSDNDYHQRIRAGAVDARSLQRPSQLNATGSGSVISVNAPNTRLRKSSGSSPWDGEEPPLPGQKGWKRPSSAADSERRLAESRRAANIGQTPSGSDGEKDRRFRKKSRSRGKDLNSAIGATSGSRYGHPRDNYDYITYDDDIDDDDYADEDYDDPTDEDKFERLNRRRHEMHQRMLETERRHHAATSKAASYKPNAPITTIGKKFHSGGRPDDYDFDDYDEQTPTPRSNTSASTQQMGGTSTKFSFDGGFESDFNQSSPPPAPAGTASSCNSTPAATTSATTTPATKSSFRFSNDFSEREKMHAHPQNSTSISSLQQFELEGTTSPASHSTPPVTQKLRFDDNVKVSQFDDAAFEDDFSKQQFDFEKEDQWHADALQSSSTAAAAKKQNLRNNKLQHRQELIKKSESINIFAKKAEDPFEDDEFFKDPTDLKNPENINNKNKTNGGNGGNGGNPNANGNGNGHVENDNTFQWDDSNFAKFDENM